ncbi:MAG: 16S rRNA (cytosine(967)-C(5))-methyltransferase RsmB [bacterium]
MPVTAREAALNALLAYRMRGARPEMLLLKEGLERREHALASHIVGGVLQNCALLDTVIARASQRKLTWFQPVVLEILRISAYQLLFLSRIPARAILSEGVELTKKRARPAAGLVNAVLRKIPRELPAFETEDPLERLSLRYSHPLWLVRELCETYGMEAAEAILRADNAPAPVTLFRNPLRPASAPIPGAEPHPFLPDALMLSGRGAIDGLEAFQRGELYVQDAAAHLAVLAAGPEPGMHILDACAAPGGKSFAAALRMENRGHILACDIHEKKLNLIRSGAERLGISIIETRARDAREPLAETFDLVLCDVPCSGMGVIRKKPEIRYKDPAALVGLPAVQLAILRASADCVKKGGALLYSTCTILRRENEDVISTFLAERPEFHPEPFALPGPFGECAGVRTILPHEADTDGFFIAKLRKD